MADLERDRGTPGAGPPRAPRWLRVVVAVVVAAVVLALVVALWGGGSHGPGRHVGAGPTAGTGANPVSAVGPSGPSPVVVDLL